MGEIVQSGLTYRITNAKAGTVVDLSGGDNRSIIGYPYHAGPNQHVSCQPVDAHLDGPCMDHPVSFVRPLPQLGWNTWRRHPPHCHVDPVRVRHLARRDRQSQLPHLRAQHQAQPGLVQRRQPYPGYPITLWYQWAGIHQTWKFERV
ncbi:hypothetical protein B0H16DRAFT_49119 [Mycena metata]|uniref:Uncharacterized protein n=1 Tax=Mycena metata TaxID=1033252 RepID=A0AAD7IG89_9AGAR|nr:hypothetical protein B0H16DRAFT_49119 [Mycena metata]